MPDVRLPSGRIISNVPDGVTQAQLKELAIGSGQFTEKDFTLPPTAPAPEEPFAIAQPEEVPDASMLESLADIGLGVQTGFVNILGSVADATAGADSDTSKAIKAASEHLQGLLSAEGQADKERAAAILKDAEDKGLMEGVQAGLQAVAADPSGMISQGVGSAIPFIAAGLTTGLPGLMTLGGVSGAGIVKGEIYQAVEAELLKQGEDPAKAAEAASKAQEYGGQNLDQILLGTGLGVFAALGPVERLGMMQSLKGGILARLGKGAVAEAVPEAIQAGQEAVAGNIALQREGFDVDTFRGVAGAATSEGLVGGLIGGPISMVAGPRADEPLDTEADTTAEDDEVISALVAENKAAPTEQLEAEQAEVDDVPIPSAEPDSGRVEPSVSAPVEPGPQTVEDVTPAPLPTEPRGVETTERDTGVPAVGEPDIDEALKVSEEMAQVEAELAEIEQDFEGLVEDAMNLGQSEAEAVKEITDTQIAPRQQKLRELRTQAVAMGTVEGRRISDEELGVGARPKAGRRGVQDIDPEQAAAQVEQQLQKPKKMTKKSAREQAQEDFSAAGSQVTNELLNKAEEIRQTEGDAIAVTYLERLGVLERKRERTASKQIQPARETKAPQTKIQEAFIEAKAKMEAEETPAEEQVADTGLQPKGKDPEKEAARKASQAINRDTPRIVEKARKKLDEPVPTDEEILARVAEEGEEIVIREEMIRRAERVQALADAIRIIQNPRTVGATPDKPTIGRTKAQELIRHPSVTLEEMQEARALVERNPTLKVDKPKGEIQEYGRDATGKEDRRLDKDGVARADIVDDTSVATDDTINQELGQFDRAPALLDYIIETGNKFEQLLARRIKKAVSDINIVVIRDLDNDVPGKYRKEFEGRNAARGIYVHDTRTVYINDTRARASGLTNTILLHELVHGATLGVLGTRATEILTGNENLMSSTARTAVDFLRDLMVDARGTYLEMKAKGLTTPREDRLYEIGAFDDLNEFVAYGFTQPEMQDFLSGIPGAFNKVYAKRGNLWSQFIGAIRKIFNIPDADANGFTDLITLGDILIDAPYIDATPADMVQAAKKVKKLRRAEEKVLRSRTADDVNTGIGELIKATTTDWTKAGDILKSKWGSLTTATIQGLNLFLTADQISDWAASIGLTKLKEVNDIIQMKMNPAKFRILEELKKNVDLWNDFNKAYPNLIKPFADFLNIVTLAGIDPTQYQNVDEALQNSPEIIAAKKAVTDAEQAGESAAKIRGLKGQVTKLEEDTRMVFSRWDELGRKTKNVTRKRVVRDANFDPIKLADGKFKTESVTAPEAHLLFEAVRDHYYELYVKRKRLLEQQIMKAGLEGEVDDPSTPLGRAMEGLRETFENADKVKIYFPLMRYGQYWVRIGKGQGKIFAMFESQSERDMYIRSMYRAMKEKGEALELDELFDLDFIASGNSTENFGTSLLSLAPGDQGALILRKIEKALDGSKTLDADGVKQLKDQMYQMYLMTLPDRDIRKRFSKRKGTAGFSGDGLRSMIVNGVAAANQLSRLEYASDVRRLLEEARDNQVTGDIDERNKREAMIDAYFGRVKQELVPEYDESILDKMAVFGNQTSFLMLLTSIKSAVVQFTQLPIVGTPVLAAKYGFAKTTKMMGNYAFLFNKLGLTKRDPKTGEIITRFGQPSIGDSKYAESKPHLRRAWEWGHEINFFQDNLAADVAERTDKPTDIYSSGLSKAGRTVYRFMTGAFYHAERITREIMFMSAFELEYDRLKKMGKSDEDAFNEGVEEAYRLSVEALFNYNRFNKPPIMKDYPLGRVAFQFMTYTQQMVAFMYNNFRGMLPFMDNKQKKEAATKFFGTMFMTGFVFSGITGLPFYSIIMNTLTALHDPEDEDGDDANPLAVRNKDVWFRSKWIPDTFGEGSDLAKLLNLDAEDSRMLERVAEMGLISAVTDLNIGASTSLDTLFFASDNLGRDTRSQLQEFVFTNLFGPTGSLVLGAVDGVEDIQNGDVIRGLEKFTPAMFRGAVKNLRLMEQGEMARTGAVVGDFNKEFFAANPEKLVGQAFGFASTEVAQEQKRNILLKRMEIAIKEERGKALANLNNAVQKFNNNPSEANFDLVDKRLQEISDYNRENMFMPITNETINKSLSNKAKKLAQSNRGLIVDKNLAPFLYDLQIKPRP